MEPLTNKLLLLFIINVHKLGCVQTCLTLWWPDLYDLQFVDSSARVCWNSRSCCAWWIKLSALLNSRSGGS